MKISGFALIELLNGLREHRTFVKSKLESMKSYLPSEGVPDWAATLKQYDEVDFKINLVQEALATFNVTAKVKAGDNNRTLQWAIHAVGALRARIEAFEKLSPLQKKNRYDDYYVGQPREKDKEYRVFTLAPEKVIDVVKDMKAMESKLRIAIREANATQLDIPFQGELPKI